MLHLPLKNHASLKVSDRCVVSPRFGRLVFGRLVRSGHVLCSWKMRVISTWHSCPGGKWGRVEDLKRNGGLGLLADFLVQKRWGSSNTVFVGCLGMKSERIVSWLMKFSGSNSFRAAPAFHPERMKMVLWWNTLKTEAIEFKEHLHQPALFFYFPAFFGPTRLGFLIPRT